jgi:hypothetical protein
MNESFPDLDRFRLPTHQHLTHAKTNSNGRKSSSNARTVQGEFLKGPIPLNWLGRASKLPGKASLATALAIMFEVGRRRSSQITLTTAILDRFGINRKAKYRGLEQLENAQLITVDRRPRRNPIVTVLAVDGDESPCSTAEKSSASGNGRQITENNSDEGRKNVGHRKCAG